MRQKYLRLWIGPVSILLLGLLGAALIQAGWIPDLIFLGNYRFDLAALLFFSAVILCLGWIVANLAVWRSRQRLERVLHEERLIQADERQRFLRRLDHELKNPLTTIRLGIANLKEERGEPNTSGTLERIAQQAQRLQVFVEDLRHLAEMEASSLDRTQVSVQEILQEAVDLACSMPEWRGREVKITAQQVPWPLSPVYGDRDLLVVAFRNLIENALKFSNPDGRVEVHAYEDGHGALVEIADDGCGILPEDQPHIFTELFRGENARDLPGSGLGLALVHRIVELHDGKVDFSSRPQQGTIVRVHLPMSSR